MNPILVETELGKSTAQVVGNFSNPYGWWSSPLDTAIRKVAGEIYHGQMLLPAVSGRFRNGKVFLAKAEGQRSWPFEAVAFICDDLRHPLEISELVSILCEAVWTNGYTSLLLPLPRMDIESQRLFLPRNTLKDLAAVIKNMNALYPALQISVLCDNDAVLPHVKQYFG